MNYKKNVCTSKTSDGKPENDIFFFALFHAVILYACVYQLLCAAQKIGEVGKIIRP